jgi:hypothetical protein
MMPAVGVSCRRDPAAAGVLHDRIVAVSMFALSEKVKVD